MKDKETKGEEEEEEKVILRSIDQRQPLKDEPECVLCGKYGAYICDLTDEDVCSIECRDKCLNRFKEKNKINEEKLDSLRRELDIQVKGTQIPPLMYEFCAENFPSELVKNMQDMHFEKPTPVQMQVIPCALTGRDLIVQAPTGSGKTASYLIPLLCDIIQHRFGYQLDDDNTVVLPLGLILAPVREICIQIEDVAKQLMKQITNMKTALIVGGLPVPPQIYRLESGVQLIVATPGRLLDILINYDICLPEGKMLFDQIRCCVVDEVDVMLGIGFQKQIVQLLSHLPQLITKDDNDRKRNIQMLFFSATITKEVNALAHKFMSKNIEETSYHITVGGANGLCNSLSTTTKEKEGYKASLNLNIIQHIEWVETKAKKKILFAYLKDHQLFGHQDTTGQTLVFVESKIGADILAEAIETKCPDIRARSIHSDKSQQERLEILEAFVEEKIDVLVSTNVLSRGIDLLQVNKVIVFDFPKTIQEYIHLIGRTAHSPDSKGHALAFVNAENGSLFPSLIALLRQANVTSKKIPKEIYQTIAATRIKTSISHVQDESKRAFRILSHQEMSIKPNEWHKWQKFTTGSNKMKRRRLTS